MAKKYWESNAFKHIQLKDLKFLDYSSDSNKRRDGRARVLARVAQRHGKDIPLSVIVVHLGYSR